MQDFRKLHIFGGTYIEETPAAVCGILNVREIVQWDSGMEYGRRPDIDRFLSYPRVRESRQRFLVAAER